MTEQMTDDLIRKCIDDIDERALDQGIRIDALESNFAKLAVLVNNIRQCVDTQTSIFEEATRRR